MVPWCVRDDACDGETIAPRLSTVEGWFVMQQRLALDCEKGKRVDGVARTITFPPGAVPGLEELLDMWEALHGSTTARRT